MEVPNTIAKFDLTFNALERPDGSIELSLEYCTELFLPATAAKMLDNFLALMTEGAAAEYGLPKP